MYFSLESRLAADTQCLHADMTMLSEENKQLRQKLHTVTKEKQSLEKKLQQQSAKYSYFFFHNNQYFNKTLLGYHQLYMT